MTGKTDATAKLEWGETPFDRLTPEEARLELCRMWSAIVAMRSCMHTDKAVRPQSPYWGPEGSGGKALDKADQIVEPIKKRYGGEDIYRCFFRYANDLLFDSSRFGHSQNWTVCPECGDMISSERPPVGEKCRAEDCTGTMRLLTWEDLKAGRVR